MAGCRSVRIALVAAGFRDAHRPTRMRPSRWRNCLPRYYRKARNIALHGWRGSEAARGVTMLIVDAQFHFWHLPAVGRIADRQPGRRLLIDKVRGATDDAA